MDYAKFLKSFDMQLKKHDKIICQFLLLERFNKNCSFLSIFENLKSKYNAEYSFKLILKSMCLLNINLHCNGLCPENVLANGDYKIDDKKMFIVKLYEECSDKEFNYLLKTVFDFTDDEQFLTIQNIFAVLLDFKPKQWNNTMKMNIMKFANDRGLKHIERLVSENLDLFKFDRKDRRQILDRYEIYEDRIDFCLIYNAYTFKSKSVRRGSDLDVRAIKETFETIRGFEIKIEEIESKEIFFESLSSYLNQCEKSDMIVCFFMSHGNHNSILSENEEEINIKSILNMFRSSRCLHLRNKPKLLIFQACRGNEKNLLIDSDTCPIQFDSDSGSQRITSPDLSDYFLYFPTSEGYVASRSPDSGSEFIQLVCTTIKNNHKT